MNLSDFKLLKEDQDSYEIGHPNGRSMRIEKKGMSEKAHKAIQMYAGGGEVGEAANAIDTFVNNQSSPAPNPVQDLGQQIQAPQADQNAQLPQQAPAPDRAPASAAPAGSDAPMPSQNPQLQQAASSDPLLQNKMDSANLLNQEEKNVKDYVGATNQINSNIQGFYKDYNNAMKGMQSPQDIVNSYKQKDDALMKAYMDNKIDPNRYLQNMSTGSKISAGIGLLLAGALGGDVKHVYQQVIGKAIDADIDAQKNAQEKNLNLFKMNQQALGSDLEAQKATQNQLLSGVQAKIAMATAQSGNAEAKLRGQQMISQIEQQKADNRLTMGMLAQNQGQTGQGGGNNVDPALLVPKFIKDPAQQKTAYDEIGKAQNAKKSYDEMLDAFDDAAKSNTILRTGFGKLRTPESVNKLENMAFPLIRDQDGKVSEFEKTAYDKMLPAPGDSDAKIKAKRQDMIDFWKAKMAAPTTKGASGGAIDLTKFNSTNLPQPAQTKIVGGIKYARGPNGEAIRVN